MEIGSTLGRSATGPITSTGPLGGLSGSREEAEDLVQETFARVLRQQRMLRSEEDLGYLLRALRNAFISTRRAAARRLGWCSR
ncbi:MAG: hypothetical protein JO181_15100 [Solirubrobacterales bacterium]|nr:hypothetical protein [Solirubrobacterales bacterium]